MFGEQTAFEHESRLVFCGCDIANENSGILSESIHVSDTII
jgi:hypothetical protein